MNRDRLPKVAVLLAAYNGEKYIQEQIESIIKQIGVDIHIHISIDTSTDRTLDICKDLKKSYKNIFILKEDKEPFGSAGKNFYHLIKNVDFKEYDFIALSDQDDIWRPSKVIRGIKVLDKEKASGYSSDVECFWEGSERKKIIIKSFPQKTFDYIFEPAGPGCTYILRNQLASVVKKEVLTSNSLPYHHDWFIYAFARANNFKWHIDNFTSIMYRQHANNQVGANLGFRQKLKRLTLLKNGSYKQQYFEILDSIGYNESQKQKIRVDLIRNPFKYRRNTKESIILFLFALLGWI